MTKIYCRTYDINLKLNGIFISKKDYNTKSWSINPNIEINEYFEPQDDGLYKKIWFLLYKDPFQSNKDVNLNLWFTENGWNSEDGFDTDEKKILFRLKFL